MPQRIDCAWNRYWVRRIERGDDPTMQEGYFVEPADGEMRIFASQSNGASLASLRKVPCLVLLGDVGMGKTTSVKREAEELTVLLSGQKHAVFWRDLKTPN